MHVEADLRARLHQPSSVVIEGVAVLADGILVQVDSTRRRSSGSVRFNHVRHDVVHDLPCARLDLHSLDPPVLRQTRVSEVVEPPVRSVRVHLVGPVHLHDEIRLADVPRVFGRELLRRRHVGRVARGGPGVGPSGDQGNLVVGQRQVILVLPDADGLIQVPRRHLAVRDARADRPRPRTHLFVGRQRHRRRRARVVAGRALVLEDGRDVLGERRSSDCHRGCLVPGDHDVQDVIGPAAVVAEVTRDLAGPIVHHAHERVFARFAEGRRGRGLPVAQRLPLGREGDLAWTAVLRPLDDHASRFGGVVALLRTSVVGGRNVQRDGAPDADRRRVGLRLHRRRQVRVYVVDVPATRRPHAVDLPLAAKRAGNRLSLAVHGQRPEHLAGWPEVLRHRHLEDVLVAARVEVRWLALVRPGLEPVVGAHRQVDRFFEVPVHVPEPHVEGPVRVDVESLVDRGNALASPMAGRRDAPHGGALGPRRDGSEKPADRQYRCDHRKPTYHGSVLSVLKPCG